MVLVGPLLALLVYPGVLLSVAAGLPCELAVARGPRRLLSAARSMPMLGALLAGLAATQLAIPFNPLPPADRDLLVATVSLLAALWLGRGEKMTGRLVPQVGWMVAQLSPAVVVQSLLPQTLAAVALPTQIPVKVMATLLALLSLPGLLGLEEPRPDPLRALCWFPACGLVVSVLVPAYPGGILGPLAFCAATWAVALLALAAAALARRLGAAYPCCLGIGAAVVVGLAAATAVL
jgi:hypothetical protein